ncbi:MAG: radical SAM protein [Pseudomonadota bacterium]
MPFDILNKCSLCGHACRVDRLAGEKGVCGLGPEIKVAAHLLHFGEEPPLSGERGSGTIFFSGCPLSCVFCQNFQVSQENKGREVSSSELARLMLDLQSQGAHNINLVSPTPYAAGIIPALSEARRMGLAVPLVYNTGGFDGPAALRMLDGLVDVYLPDAKYAWGETAEKYSGAANYVGVNRAALREMHRQAGPLRLDENGLARGGVLIRHLVLPGRLAETEAVLAWLKKEFGPDVWISLMAQYAPFFRAAREPGVFPELERRLTEDEYEAAMDAALDLGLENVFIQETSSAETYLPDFDRPEVFSRE